MTNIKYICISDVHLGADTAILTDTPAITVTKASGEERDSPLAYCAAPLRAALAKALTATLSLYAAKNPPAAPAGIVLLGDILDLSLGTPRHAIDDFDRLLKALTAAGAQSFLGQFIFIPGNHDHELWTVARYDRMVGKDRKDDDFKHVTKAFDAPSAHPVAPIMQTVLAENGYESSATYYPNMGLTNANSTRAVVLHHGHFVESTYRVMSSLVAQLASDNPADFDAESLEILNANWIDFLWSSDGDDGRLGRDIQTAYKYLLTGADDIRFDHRLAKLITEKISTTLPLAKTASTRKLVAAVSKALVDSVVGQYGQTERFSYAQLLGADSLSGLRSYIKGPVLKQLAAENPGKAIEGLTFIFGHTHKPFEDRMVSEDFKIPVDIYNTGGWDLDTPMFDTKLGAALVFIDDDLNVASLRVCRVPEQDGAAMTSGEPFKVHVATADGDILGNPLASRLDQILQICRKDWEDFATEAENAYRAKQSYTMALLARNEALDRKSGSVL